MPVLWSEDGLFDRFVEGDAEVLARVYWTFVEPVTRVIRAVFVHCGRLRTREVARELPDLVQQVFADAFEPVARRRVDGGRDYGPYLCQIARNVAVDFLRRTRRQVLLEDVEAIVDGIAFDRRRADFERLDPWADAPTMAAVDRYIAKVEPQLQLVHHALYVAGMSQRDAAATLGLGRQRIRTLDSKLRDGLRVELVRAGCLEEEDFRPRRRASPITQCADPDGPSDPARGLGVERIGANWPSDDPTRS